MTLIRLGQAPRVIGQVATAASARTIALDPSTGRAYLPSARMVLNGGRGRPMPVAGSFRVIVLAP